MKTYLVTKKEVHNSIHRIDADSMEEAVQKVQDGEENEISFEYCHTEDDITAELEGK